MRIIKILSKKQKNKDGKEISYYKYMLNLPKNIIQESKFEDKELIAEFKNDKITIKIKS